MDYEQKFLLFKKLIDKTFSSYKKKYSVNFLNKTYQVKFILTDRLIALTILPDSEWHEFKKQIEKKISNISFALPECHICFNQIVHVTYCRQCSFIICLDCFRKIQLNNGLFRCPQCRYIPHQINEEPATSQWMKFLSLWTQYESEITA